MATRFVEGINSTDISAELTRLAGETTSSHTPLLYDLTNGVLKFYDRVASGLKQLATLTGTETFTNKTLTAPTITTPSITSAPTPVTLTGAAALSAATHGNRSTFLNAVAGGQVDLPAATGTGNVYKLFVITALTSASWVFRTNVATGDRFTGGVHIDDTGDTGAVAAAAFFPAGASDEVLTMAFAATLGTIGAWVEFTDIKTGIWAVNGYLGGSVDPATPWGVATT